MKPYCSIRIVINPHGDLEIRINLIKDHNGQGFDVLDYIGLDGFLEPEQKEMLRQLFSREPELSRESLTRWLSENPFLLN